MTDSSPTPQHEDRDPSWKDAPPAVQEEFKRLADAWYAGWQNKGRQGFLDALYHAYLLAPSETKRDDKLGRAYDAAVAFIESHVADPDITEEMTRKYAEYKEARAALEEPHVAR